MEENQNLPDWPRGITFEQYWASLMETKRELQEGLQELREFQSRTDAAIAEIFKRLDTLKNESPRLNYAAPEEPRTYTSVELEESHLRHEASMDESSRYLDKTIKESRESISFISDRLLVPNLLEEFKKIGLTFRKPALCKKLGDERKGIYLEIDALLENNKVAMAVEVKPACTIDDVENYLTRMEKIRRFADFKGDKRSYLGAIATSEFSKKIQRYALAKGLYLIKASWKDEIWIWKPNTEKVW